MGELIKLMLIQLLIQEGVTKHDAVEAIASANHEWFSVGKSIVVAITFVGDMPKSGHFAVINGVMTRMTRMEDLY